MNTEICQQSSNKRPRRSCNIKKAGHKKVNKKKGNIACRKCSKIFPNAHVARLHSRYCLRKYNFEKAYKDAIKTSLLTPESNIIKLKPISCDECSKKFKIKKHFLAHVENEHSKLASSVACDKCSVRCPSKSVLKEHIQNVHERQMYECPNCNTTFARPHHVLRHISQKGCDGSSAANYPCEICDAIFSRKDNLMVHLRFQHIQKKKYNCKVCLSYYTRNFNKLVAHWTASHNTSLECDHCGKSCSSRAALTKHMEIHGEKKYVCDVCNYRTFTVEVMRRHILTHVDDKPFKCTICPKSYIQSSQLRNHLIKHIGHKCNECDMSFNNKYDLVLHKSEHTGEKQQVCIHQDCPYATKPFENKERLISHLKTHDERAYKCEVCHKRYSSSVYLRNHMAVHTLERPRRCMYCVSARAYIRGEQLLKHVRKQHASVFHQHLLHVRKVLGIETKSKRVRKSELESILNVIDAECERIVSGCGEGVLYGGMVMETEIEFEVPAKTIKSESPLMSEEELADSLRKLLTELIDKDTLECFGWPDEQVDIVLERVIDHCGAKPADRTRWTRVQTLRENAKYLFLHAIEDKVVTNMLTSHTIDQVIKHMLDKVTDNVLEEL